MKEKLPTYLNNVLYLSKIESGHIEVADEVVDLKKLTDDCHSIIAPMAKKRDISFHYTQKPLYVHADQLRLKQVLINLLSNGVKYNRHKGNLNLDYRLDKDDPTKVLIEVSDTGTGMNKKQLRACFEPFERFCSEASSIEGSGIGLNIARELVTLMGGTIHAKSEVYEGTSIYIKLPLATPTELSSIEDRDDSDVERTEHITKVLYIEDNESDITIVEQYLSKEENIIFQSAHDHLEAQNLLNGDLPDIILLDIKLPYRNGLQFFEDLQKNGLTRDIPVIGVSASALDDTIEQANEVGFSEFFTKPFDLAQLLKSIHKHTEKKQQ